MRYCPLIAKKCETCKAAPKTPKTENCFSCNKKLYFKRGVAKRQPLIDRATPPWLSRAQKLDIEAIYNLANEMRPFYGSVHVDHIVPIQGDNVSGLHVPWNLQLMTGEDNRLKGNKI